MGAKTKMVVGATGMTGRFVVEYLLNNSHKVKAIVRSPEKLTEAIRGHPNLTLIHATLLDLSDDDMQRHLQDCDTIFSCLGHVMSLRGIFFPPRDLCAQAVRRLCNASTGDVKFI